MISVVEKQDTGPSIRLMCATASVSPSGYRNWRDTPDEVADRHEKLAAGIKKVWEESGCTYGSERVHAELVRSGDAQCCERTARKIMANRGWSSVHPRPWRCTTQSDGSPPAPDLIRRDFRASRPGVRLVGDITQINTWGGPIFLATVIDLFSREVIGYAIDDHHGAELVCAALVMARRDRRVRRRAIFHSDRGSEYTSKSFRECLRRGGMRQSMGAVGTAYDNSLAESFFASLKKECVYPTVFDSKAKAKLVVEDYIVNFYNCRRLHSGVGFRPPVEVRRSYGCV